MLKTPSPPTAFACAALVALLAGCGGDSAGAGPGGGSPWGARPLAVVTTAAVEQGAFTVDARFVGTLEAETSAELYARTSGQIVEIHTEIGEPVRAGQLLARIDSADARQRVDQAQAALRIAEATLGQRQANVDVAEATSRRTEALFGQSLVAQQDYDTVAAELIGARSQLELARAQIAQAQSNLSAARLELDKTRVVAPFGGFVGKRYLDRGDLATTARPLFSIVDLATIRTTISITDKDAARVRVGQPATVTTASYPGRAFPGVVARMASVFDPETNTTEAEVEVANPEALLKPGMFADVAVSYRTEPTALLVPASAVVETGDESYLFLAERATGDGAGTPGARPAEGRPGGGRPGGSGAPDAPGGPAGADAPQWVARKVAVDVIGTGVAERGDGPAGGPAESKAESMVAVEASSEPLGGGLRPGARVIVLGQDSLSDGAPISPPAAGGERSSVAPAAAGGGAAPNPIPSRGGLS